VITIRVGNVGHALKRGLQLFDGWAHSVNTLSPRGSPTLEAPEPVCTVYALPTERVLFSPTRDANPFFHFFESLWMLAGRNELHFLTKLNKQMAAFSDDGSRIWGAYGWRWRGFFGYDQIPHLVSLLRADPQSRRAVLTMWSAIEDVRGNFRGEGGPNGKDVPCNTHIYFKIRDGRLNMTVCNRSNDMLWGAYGANVVHMSMLQEYVAEQLNVRVGTMRQVSDSLHVYLPPHKGGELWEKLRRRLNEAPSEFEADPYCDPHIKPFPLGSNHPAWDSDLQSFMRHAMVGEQISPTFFDTPFFREVVSPLWIGWEHRSVEVVDQCRAQDWRKAAREWLLRRKDGRPGMEVSL
jgi:hypothetical protein